MFFVINNANIAIIMNGQQVLKKTLLSVPEVPGIYKMLGDNGEVLYVGKAKNLKNRLKNYLNKGLTTRIMTMVSLIRNIEYISTNTEADALLLESRLIKQHQPKYNVLLKDDRSFPYIKARFDHEFAQLIKYRGKITNNAKYFGPFANVSEVNRVLTFLHKTFKLRNCSDNYFNSRKRPCLQYQIGRCSAPCVGKITKEGYAASIKEAIQFLDGRSAELQKSLAKQMDDASKNEDYEQAAMIRDKIKGLSYIQGKASNHINLLYDIDVVVAIKEASLVAISITFYRGGHSYGHKIVFIDDGNGDIALAISSFISKFYQSMPIPKEIIINIVIEDKELLEEAFTQLHGTKIKIIDNAKAERKKLIEGAELVAIEALHNKAKLDGVNRQIYEEIAEVFGLNKVPERIEIYDNSHIMGTSAVGAFVVASPDGFHKKEYRHYNVENKIGDDYAMLREVINRRLTKCKNGDGASPDLMLIDGGKGQLSTVLDVMKRLDIEVPVVAIAKGPERNAGREVFFLASGKEITFDRNNPLMKYLQILRDEAHRFAITTHRKKRSKLIAVSSLDNIDDIGPARKKALLGHFGSMDAISEATPQEIAKVDGISLALAKRIHENLSAK